MNRFANKRLASVAWYRTGILGVGILGVGMAIFLSVKSSPSLSKVPMLPHSIANWANRHGRLCNFPAYALVALPFLVFASRWSQRACVVVLLAILIVALEIVQRWIPTRVCDKWDVFWGCSGLLASWVVIELIRLILVKTNVLKQAKP